MLFDERTTRSLVVVFGGYVAVLAALYTAFLFDLTNPWWAMLTVFLTQPIQPLTGAIWAKALYRATGTVVGGIACVVFIPTVSSSPGLLFFVIAGWLALCVYLGALVRSPRSYAFLLSGYTLAFVGLPAARTPENIFNITVLRVEEILIGVFAFAIVQSLLFPKRVGPVVLAKLDAVMNDAREWINRGLQEPTEAGLPTGAAARLTEINLLATDWYFEGEFSQTRRRALWALEERLVMLLPTVTAVHDRLVSVQDSGDLDGRTLQVLTDIRKLMSGGVNSRPESIAVIESSLADLTPTLDTEASWSDLISASLTARLADLVRLWKECEFLADFVHSSGDQPNDLVLEMIGSAKPRALHVDHGVALHSALVAGAIVTAAAVFSIVTQWESGTYAVALAAMSSALFVAFDNPTPILWTIVRSYFAVLPIGLLYQCAILPSIDGFPMLAVALFPAVAVMLWLYGNSKYMLIGLGLLAGFSLMLGIQPTFEPDVAAMLNTFLGSGVGFLFSLTGLSIARAIPLKKAIDRLLRAGWRELAALIRSPLNSGVVQARSRALDRVGLLIPRATRLQPDDDSKIRQILRDAKLMTAVAELKFLQTNAPAAVRREIDSFLTSLAQYLDSLHTGMAVHVPISMVHSLDRTISGVLSLANRDDRQAGVDAAINLRRVLFPDAPAYSQPEHQR
ncbi:FUSC family protein [Paraburkholderia sp. C35]|uniref:FUSC family protein n=1 Tax=Paraburkholderia sp. C35 TaxID=2126993 RepID=UPI000D68B75C|nr:FUSC family protein [Paraburkholderia sp. C35]